MKSSLFIGLGDLKIRDISYLPDPCPLPEQIKKRALVEKEKLIYAPFSGVGGIVYDKDAVYVELGGSHSHNKKENNETDDIVTNLIETKETLDVKMEHSELQLFSGGKKLTARDFDSDSDNDDSDTEPMQLYEKDREKEQSDLEAELEVLRKKDFGKYKEEKVENSGRIRRKVIFNDSDEELDDNIEEEDKYTTLKINRNDEIHCKIKGVLKTLENRSSFEPADLSGSDDESSDDATKEESAGKQDSDSSTDFEDDVGVKWKENLAKKAENAFLERQTSTKNLMKLVYGTIFSVSYIQKLYLCRVVLQDVRSFILFLIFLYVLFYVYFHFFKLKIMYLNTGCSKFNIHLWDLGTVEILKHLKRVKLCILMFYNKLKNAYKFFHTDFSENKKGKKLHT